jgi:hypothetical protein
MAIVDFEHEPNLPHELDCIAFAVMDSLFVRVAMGTLESKIELDIGKIQFRAQIRDVEAVELVAAAVAMETIE